MKPIRTLSPHSFGVILVPSHLHPGLPSDLCISYFSDRLCINLSRLSCVWYPYPPYPSWCDQMWKWESVNLGARALKIVMHLLIWIPLRTFLVPSEHLVGVVYEPQECEHHRTFPHDLSEACHFTVVRTQAVWLQANSCPLCQTGPLLYSCIVAEASYGKRTNKLSVLQHCHFTEYSSGMKCSIRFMCLYKGRPAFSQAARALITIRVYVTSKIFMWFFTVNIKVKFTLEQAVKAQRGRSIAILFL